MNQILLLGMPGGWEWVVILVVILLLFGGSRLPQLAKALGQSKRAFREGQDEAEEEARLDKERRKETAEQQPKLTAVDDEELFEEARRRASLRGAETSKLEEGKLTSDKSSR
jgi:sec-independent protein translocase protein TatA